MGCPSRGFISNMVHSCVNRSAATTHRDSAALTSSGTGFSAVPSVSLNVPSVTLK